MPLLPLQGVTAQYFFAFGTFSLTLFAYAVPSWRALCYATAGATLVYSLVMDPTAPPILTCEAFKYCRLNQTELGARASSLSCCRFLSGACL